MYTFKTKVRYSEISSSRLVKPESIVNYLQDCVMFQTNAVGGGVDYYKRECKVWVLNSWQIEIKRQLIEDEEIPICTWPYDFAGAYGHRNFVVKDQAGEDVIVANTLWVFTDITTGRPIKITEEVRNFYQIEDKLDMEYMDRKVKIADGVTGEEQLPVPVLKGFIDTNGHVNNGKYIGCASEYIPDGYKVERIRAEYKRAAVYGDTFYPVVYRQDVSEDKAHIWIALNNEDGNVYATVQFDIYK